MGSSRKTHRNHGAVERTNLVLPLLLGGVVVDGDHRGRELGFPTANFSVPVSEVAPEGVFAGTVQRADGTVYRSAISVGRRETFYSSTAPSLVEAHLLDFTGNLYGEHLRVELIAQLRTQERFDSISDLIDQIRADVALVREQIDLDHFRSASNGERLSVLAANRKSMANPELTKEPDASNPARRTSKPSFLASRSMH